MLPNLFVGGAAKSGTTTLHYWLQQHPDVFFPRWPQEIHYYDQDYFYKKGLKWFRKHFSFAENQKIIAQTSPGYLYYPHVPARVHRDIPDAKFIFSLRNPIDRAYSEYWMNVMYGFENLSFEQAIEQEEDRIVKNPRYELYFAYKNRGRYYEQISRFLEFFPREKILIFLFEDIKSDGKDVLRICSDFLEINFTEFETEHFKFKNYNPSRVPRIKSLQRLSWGFRKYLPLYGVYGPLKRLALPSYVIDFFNLKKGVYPPLGKEMRNKLIDEFREDILNLQDFLSRDLSHWLKSE